MHDSLGVRGGESRGDLDPQLQGAGGGHRPLVQGLPQRLPFDVLGDDVGRAIEGSHVVHRHDAGMVDLSRGAGLLLEALQAIRVGGEALGQHLDRHVAREAVVAGAIDLPHAARAEKRDDFVGTDACAGCDCHWNVFAGGRPGSPTPDQSIGEPSNRRALLRRRSAPCPSARPGAPRGWPLRRAAPSAWPWSARRRSGRGTRDRAGAR